MEAVLKVMRSGNSDVVTIPAAWKRRRGIKTGDMLRVSESPDGDIILTPIKEQTDQQIRDRLRAIRKENSKYSKLKNITIEEMKDAAHDRDR